MDEWSEKYFLYDSERKFLKSFSTYKSARKYSDNLYTRGVESFITIERIQHLKPENFFIYRPGDASSLPLNKKIFWKKLSNYNGLKIFEDFPVRVMELIYEKAKDLYYNSSDSFLTDRQFDYLETLIIKRNPKSIVLKTGADIKITDGKIRKVALPYYMGSMDKLQDFTSWDKTGPYLITEKLDGISLLYENDGGTLRLFTRGNGSIGQDVSHLLNVVDLPKIGKNIAVRGEILMKKSAFKKYKNKFSNPRNMVGGLINRKSKSPELINADFIAFQLLNPLKKPSDQYKSLKGMGFKIPVNRLTKTVSNELLEKTLKEWKKKNPYHIDGLVVYDDRKYPVNTSGNPDFAKAFKKNFKEDSTKAEVLRVEWNISRLGVLKPVIIIKPVHIKGSTIRRVTGHNAKNIIRNNIGRGALVRVLKSGDIIPHILEVLKPGKPNYPDVEWKWNATDTDMILKNDLESQARTVNRLTYSLASLGVENIGSGLVSLLVEEGVDSLPEIRKTPLKKLTGIIGPKRASDLQKNLEIKLKTADMKTLMVASNAFGTGFGHRKFETLLEDYPSFAKMDSEKISTLVPAKGFSKTSMEKIAAAKPGFDKWMKSLDLKPERVAKKNTKGRYSGKVFLFSGTRDAKARDAIIKHGGSVAESFVKSVTHLIVKDNTRLTGKMKTALERGTIIKTLDDMKKELGL